MSTNKMHYVCLFASAFAEIFLFHTYPGLEAMLAGFLQGLQIQMPPRTIQVQWVTTSGPVPGPRLGVVGTVASWRE